MRFRSERPAIGLFRAALIALAALVASAVHAAPIEPGEIRVIDGDTIAAGQPGDINQARKELP